MNAHYQRPSRASHPKFRQGLTPLFWGGSLVIGGLLVAILYCLLTHQIPV